MLDEIACEFIELREPSVYRLSWGISLSYCIPIGPKILGLVCLFLMVSLKMIVLSLLMSMRGHIRSDDSLIEWITGRLSMDIMTGCGSFRSSQLNIGMWGPILWVVDPSNVGLPGRWRRSSRYLESRSRIRARLWFEIVLTLTGSADIIFADSQGNLTIMLFRVLFPVIVLRAFLPFFGDFGVKFFEENVNSKVSGQLLLVSTWADTLARLSFNWSGCIVIEFNYNMNEIDLKTLILF